MTETYETLLPFVSVAVAVLGLVFTYFKFVIKVREDIVTVQSACVGLAKAVDCLPKMQADLVKLNAADDVFWRVLGPHLGGIIHSPVHKNRDRLMDEWLGAKGSIPESDLRELRDELEQMLAEADAGDNKNLQIVGALLLGRVVGQIEALERKPFTNGGI